MLPLDAYTYHLRPNRIIHQGERVELQPTFPNHVEGPVEGESILHASAADGNGRRGVLQHEGRQLLLQDLVEDRQHFRGRQRAVGRLHLDAHGSLHNVLVQRRWKILESD